MTLRNLQTGEYVTASVSTDQGRTVIQSSIIGTLTPEQALQTHRITRATNIEWAQLVELGYPTFLKTEELENLGPMGNFAREILLSCAGARIRVADWSWEDPILEVWWQGWRFIASFHELGPTLECDVEVGRGFVLCSWSNDLAECFQKFADQMIRA